MKNTIFIIVIVLMLGISHGCAPSSPIITPDSRLLQKYQEAKLQYLSGALEKAEQGFREVVAERGDFFQARFMLGKTLFSRGRLAEAEAVFLALAGQYPQYHEAEIWAARTELANGKTAPAVARLERLLAFDSSDPRLLALYARACQAREDAAGALQYFKLSALYEEEASLVRYEIGRYYYQFGQREKALLEIDRCLALLPAESNLRGAVEELKKIILKEQGEQK